MSSPFTGVAAGVPFTALAPAGGGPAPLIVTWHMLDAPRSDAAFAAALPLDGVRAWRVHLGLPMCGARMVGGVMDAGLALLREEPLVKVLHPFARQAAEEFPAAVESLREQLPVDGPVGLVGGSLGGAVVLRVLAENPVPVFAAALVNPAVRMRSVMELFPGYVYSPESAALADGMDFVARAGELAPVPLLVASGELDHPGFRADARELVAAVGERARLWEVPGLAHPLAEEPGIEPAPQLPQARAVDAGLAEWFTRQLG
ncbi:pimeloyl-ACP methyl ester carboxylesterase [Crossiella equi]|uniref:Pimeloyl-ACP methyl ester carboxylesterase n=1 Tax=Crossiella equi TaxID=130796 RepID=A0ABS5A3T5_9PSEU|nr:alpha/beta hydrolase [Crossiella equi]MBP2471246.1 pimeloyl-ACP methyl ester carboxylesterase [Crossiella equi]